MTWGTIQARADSLGQGAAFLGGPVKDFERVGRMQMALLIQEGLQPFSRTLDFGCGALRAGYWLIHFLAPGHYYGIEPQRDVLETALKRILEPGIEADKQPTFAHNDDFDLRVFGVRFDFVIARSIWSHTSKAQIETMLDGFVDVASPGAKMLASYVPARQLAVSQTGQRSTYLRDYRGTEWVGPSHESDTPGLVAHSRRWIMRACHDRGLGVSELRSPVIHRQRWLRILAAPEEGERHRQDSR